jgi:hypothetical protein
MKILFLFLSLGFGKCNSDSIPSFAIKFRPVPLRIDLDPHLIFSGEFFLNARHSVEIAYGNGKILKLNKNRMNIGRAEYKTYFRPFSAQKEGRGYWSVEAMYKNVIEPIYGFSLTNPQLKSQSTLNLNVAALHLKIGRTYVSKLGFPAVDVYLGLGIRGYNNIRNENNIPSNVQVFYQTPSIRQVGFGVLPSGSFGIGIGFGKWRKL